MKISKSNDLKFRTACILLVLCENAVPINENSRNGNYKIDGKNNSFELIFYENAGSSVYSVFCRFNNVVVGLGNQWSGKHNFYSTSDMDSAVKEFELFLKKALKAIA